MTMIKKGKLNVIWKDVLKGLNDNMILKDI